MCEIFIVRHGQTDWNKRKTLQGWQNTSLNDAGHAECLQAAADLRGKIEQTYSRNKLGRVLDAIYSSDLNRAKESCFHFANEFSFSHDEIHFEHGLREHNLGDIEGRTLNEAAEYFSEFWLAKFEPVRDAGVRPPNGESYGERHERFVKAVEQIAVKHHGERVLVMTHSLCFHDIVRRTLEFDDLTPDLELITANAAVIHIRLTKCNSAELDKLCRVSNYNWLLIRWANMTRGEFLEYAERSRQLQFNSSAPVGNVLQNNLLKNPIETEPSESAQSVAV
eukprot:Lankesteria_metandrocarpae@DN3897_c0_g1_i2.p1